MPPSLPVTPLRIPPASRPVDFAPGYTRSWRMRKMIFVTVLVGRLLPALLAGTACAQAVTVLPLSWPTKLAAAPVDAELEDRVRQWLPAVRLAVRTLPESAVIGLALGQAELLGLPKEQAAQLGRLVSRRYERIAQAPGFNTAPGALDYCLSETRPASGFATLVVPAGANARSRTVVFLHGYGGSFLWYAHFLHEVYPDAILLLPAYGLSGATVPAAYVSEARRAAEQRLGFPLARPQLAGLSAGGFGACRLFAARPEEYASLTVLAAYPPEDTLRLLAAGRQIRFLAGAAEGFVVEGVWQQSLDFLHRRGVRFDAATIPGADHFFLLTHEQISRTWLQRQGE